MNPVTEKEAIALAKKYKALEIPKDVELSLAVPVPFLPAVRKVFGKSKIVLGVQTIAGDKSGSHTGDISAQMLAHLKPAFSIIGHSERRAHGETDEMINQQVLAALKAKLTPVLCVGEKERDEHGFFLRTIEEQLKKALANVPRAAFPRLVVAYEPVWAIGADAARETTPDECREMMIYIKKTLVDLAHISAKEMPRIMYGGSVNELNGHEFTAAGADGLLPGRLSLDPRKMQKLMQSLQVVVLKK